MRARGVRVLAVALTTCAVATPVRAEVTPWVRFDYGTSQLRMSEGNQLIQELESAFRAAGLPASFQDVRPARSLGAGAGLWLTRSVRVGVTYARQRSTVENRLHVPGWMYFADDLDFRIAEVGAEATVRFERWAGLSLGGSVARTSAKLVEGYTIQDAWGNLFQDAVAEREKTTWGLFVGIDQTSPKGYAGYLRLGYQFRDLGEMPSQLVISDGFTSVEATGTTIGLDYSGWYLKVGCGFDPWR